jgi:hypothetical protein
MVPAQEIQRLKATLKHGPALSREGRTEFLLCQTGAAPRKLKAEIIEKLRSEIQRLSTIDRPGVRGFVTRMKSRYPELSL